MSQKNVEIVRGQIDAFNRGDFAAALDVIGEEVEWQVPEIATLDAPGSGVIRGRDMLVDSFTQWFDAWETFAFEMTEVRGLGENVFVSGLQTGRGRKSGIDVKVQTFHVFTVRDAKIARMRTFSDQSAALEAAGLEE